jgi:hypothetical protein
MAKIVATWKGIDNLQQRIASFDQQMMRTVVAQALYVEPEMTAYAKKNAPWTDRTGNARAGLHTTHKIGTNFVELIVAHSVPYGIWLEVRWSGKYAIIGPTVFWGGRLMIGRIDSTLKKMATA